MGASVSGKGGLRRPVPAFSLPAGLTGVGADIAMRDLRRSGWVEPAPKEMPVIKTAWLKHPGDQYEQVRDDWGWRVLDLLGW